MEKEKENVILDNHSNSQYDIKVRWFLDIYSRIQDTQDKQFCEMFTRIFCMDFDCKIEMVSCIFQGDLFLNTKSTLIGNGRCAGIVSYWASEILSFDLHSVDDSTQRFLLKSLRDELNLISTNPTIAEKYVQYQNKHDSIRKLKGKKNIMQAKSATTLGKKYTPPLEMVEFFDNNYYTDHTTAAAIEHKIVEEVRLSNGEFKDLHTLFEKNLLKPNHFYYISIAKHALGIIYLANKILFIDPNYAEWEIAVDNSNSYLMFFYCFPRIFYPEVVEIKKRVIIRGCSLI